MPRDERPVLSWDEPQATYPDDDAHRGDTEEYLFENGHFDVCPDCMRSGICSRCAYKMRTISTRDRHINGRRW